MSFQKFFDAYQLKSIQHKYTYFHFYMHFGPQKTGSLRATITTLESEISGTKFQVHNVSRAILYNPRRIQTEQIYRHITKLMSIL